MARNTMGRTRMPSDQASLTTEASYTTNSSSPSAQQANALRKLLLKAGNLPRELWNASAPGNDFTSLAESVTQLSWTVNQLMPALDRYSDVSSAHVWQDVADMAKQCDYTFSYIETNVIETNKINQRQSNDGAVISISSRDAYATKEVECLSALLSSIASTLEVMTQTLELAQTIHISRYHYELNASENIEAMKQMVQNGIIKQQLSLLKAFKLVPHLQLQARTPTSERQLFLSQGSPTESSYFGASASSATISLAKFQERNMLPSLFPSLSTSSAALISSAQVSERESMIRINRMAPSRVDDLLQKWTNLRINLVENQFDDGATRNLTGGMGKMNINASRRRSSLMSQEELDRRTSLQPSVESEDDESEHPGNDRRYSVGPVLEAVGEEQESISPRSRYAVPMPPNRAPNMPRHLSSPANIPSLIQPSSFPRSGLYPPQPQHSHSFSSSLPISSQTAQQRNRQETESVSSGLSSSAVEIAWRLRLDSSKWEFRDELMVKSNTQTSFEFALERNGTITELREDCVVHEVLLQHDLHFKSVPEDERASRHSRKRMIRIYSPLKWEQVKEIVEQSREILDRRNAERRQRPTRRGSLNVTPSWDQELRQTLEDDYSFRARRGSRSSNQGYDRPKLDRRNSASYRERRNSMREERDYRDAPTRKDSQSRRYSQGQRDREKSRERRYIEEEEEGDLTEKPPRSRSRGPSRRESDARRSDRYDEYEDNSERRPSNSGRRGSFVEAAKQAGRVIAPAAGLATLVVNAFGSI